MKAHNARILFLSLSLFVYSLPVYAYLDPGTGSMIIQGLIAGFAASISLLSIYWQKIKTYFSKKSKDSEEGN